MEERLKWIFKLYDTNKSGRLTKNVRQISFKTLLDFIFGIQDLNASVSAVYALLGNVSNRATTPETLSERTASVFQKFDQSQRGYLTVDDFLSSCLKVNSPANLLLSSALRRIQWSFNRSDFSAIVPERRFSCFYKK